jgi:four helix bundle protein
MTDRLAAYEGGQDIRDRSFEFACRVVEFCKKLYGQGGVARQVAPELIDASGSVASMLEEARGAESRRDFISKCCIGMKEARESHLRLRICHRCALGPRDEAQGLINEAQEIVSIVGAIVRNTRRNAGLPLDASARSRARIRNCQL